jgi:hypothetical protein
MSDHERATVPPALTFIEGVAPDAEGERRKGALATMQALRVLYASAENVGNCGNRPEDFYSWRFNDAAKLADSLGAMPPRARGAIIALAEFIHYSVHTGEPNLDRWLPVVAMTKEQLRREVAGTEEEYRNDAGMAAAPCESEGLRI